MVNAATAIPVESRPRWRRRVSATLKRNGFVPFIEIGAVVALIATIGISYFIVFERESAEALLSPPVVAGLVVAILVPAMALMILIARRVARKRAAQSP